MGRTKNPEARELVAVAHTDDAAEALRITSAADGLLVDQTDALLTVGQLQAFEFLHQVTTVTLVQSYVRLKNFAGIVGLPYRGKDGKTRRCASLEEFCEHFLGKSLRRMQELESDYRLLGGELYEQAERIGFRARDYKALRALPANDQAVVKQAIESQDREVVIDLLTELAARNEALRKQAGEKDKTLAAKDKVIQRKSARNAELEEQLATQQLLDADEAEQLKTLRNCTQDTENTLVHLLKAVDQVTAQPASDAAGLAARQALDYVVRRLCDAADKLGLQLNFEDALESAERARIRAQIEQDAAAEKAASGRNGSKH